MKAVINHIELSKHLKKISGLIKTNPVIPIMSCVLFKFSKGKLEMVATDLETTCIIKMDCECKDEFEIPIEYKDISELCSSVSSPISLEVVKGTGINISSGSSKFKFSFFGNDNVFPKIPEDEFNVEIEVDGDFFFNLSKANTFRYKGFDKPAIDMAAIDIKKDEIFIIGVDGNFMYSKSIAHKGKSEVVKMICESFTQACKSFQQSKISIGEKFIKAEYGDDVVISRLSDNKFVDYAFIMPKDAVYNFTIDKNVLKSAIRSANITTSLTLKSCVFNFKDSGVKLISQEIDFGKESETILDIEHTVEIESICLNIGQLSTILNNIESDSIDFSFSNAYKSVYIKPSDDDSIICLLQPLMINNN